MALGIMLAEDVRAPTTVRDPVAALDEHIADALSALALPCVARVRMLTDVGSGAGVPGLPLAIALPEAEVALVEATRRKCAYLSLAVERLGLDNVEVVCRRVESWPEGFGRSDVVTARALAAPDVVAEYAAPLLRTGGALVVWRGQRDVVAEAALQRAATVLGMAVQDPIAVEPYPGSLHRHLHVILKDGPTPPQFPRREGVARKRPLGEERLPQR